MYDCWLCQVDQIYHYFLFFHMFKGDNWHISLFGKNLVKCCFFLGHCESEIFQTLRDYSLTSGLHFYCMVDDLDFVSRSQVSNIIFKLCFFSFYREGHFQVIQWKPDNLEAAWVILVNWVNLLRKSGVYVIMRIMMAIFKHLSLKALPVYNICKRFYGGLISSLVLKWFILIWFD